MSRLVRLPTGLACLLALGACAAETSIDDFTPEELGSDADADGRGTTQALATGTLRLNDVYYVPERTGETDAPMYGAATSSSLVRRVPEQAAVKVVVAAPSNGRYRVDHAGTLGWMLGSDLTLRHRYDSALSSTRINALARARRAMGFSYWWSNARWPSTGPTSWPAYNRGECFGSCGGSPACTHVATAGTEYGSDCSGFVSTIWGFPDFDSNTNPTHNGFGTVAFNQDTASWKTVALADARPGDAVVRHDSTKKHIFLVATRRDSRDRFNTYECAGCDEGCRTKRRTITDGSGWHAIRRTGW
jgi:hypothetical protein